MTTWPNWVDLIVVTIILKMGYNGLGRGLVSELINIIGAVSITVLTVILSPLVTSWVSPRLALDPALTTCVIFWVLFVILWVVVHMLTRRLAALITWEKLHWFTQGLGMGLGALRGFWWASVLLVAFTSSGVTYLQASVEERSVVGLRLLPLSRTSLERVIELVPIAQERDKTSLFPAIPGTP